MYNTGITLSNIVHITVIRTRYSKGYVNAVRTVLKSSSDSSTGLDSIVSLKGNSHQKLSVANMMELLLKSFLVYRSLMFEAWKVPKRPVEVSRDVMQHLVAYRTAVGTRTNSSGMPTHTGQHSRLPCMHTLFLLD